MDGVFARHLLESRLPPRLPERHTVTATQAAAHEAIASALGAFTAFLLHGVTGSGKTEVYLAAMEAALRRGEQVLVLAPEIALTPQLVARFTERFAPLGAEAVVVLHSAMSARQRDVNWLAAQSGRARVVLGTRSAVLTPMPRPVIHQAAPSPTAIPVTNVIA